MEEIYYDIQQAIDYAFKEKKYLLNSYKYLKGKDVKRLHAQTILRSPLIQELYDYITELNLYVDGGSSARTQYAREAYGFLSKPEARKLSTYFDNIIDGFRLYINERKGTRKKPKPRRTTK